MKKLFTILITVLSLNAFGQTLKTFNGAFNDGKTQNGIAVYTYYENPETHEYLKQGSFKYTFDGKGDDYIGYNQTITGSFEKGLKNGTWTYTITMADYWSNKAYYTGTVSLVANYKNGYADGNWKEVRSYKPRAKYLQYGKYIWDAFGPVKTMTINMNFKNNYLVGAVSINDEFANFKATGTYDNNSFSIGTWIINDMNYNNNSELIYKDNFLYESIMRSNIGAVKEGTTKYQAGYDDYMKAKSMTAAERKESGLSIDTTCGAILPIQEYFPKLFSVEYFLYTFIGGDLSFVENFKGGCQIRVNTTDYTPLTNISEYKKAEEFYAKNELMEALEQYSDINLNKVKPSERKNVTDQIALLIPIVKGLVETYNKNSDFYSKYIKSQYDSLFADFNIIKQYFKIKSIKKKDPNTYKYEDMVPERYYDGRYSCDCKNPWNEDDYTAIKTSECFKLNKGFYEPYQIAITEYWNKFNEALDKEKNSVTKSPRSFKFYKIDIQSFFYAYDKGTFISNISKAKKNYEKAKSMWTLAVEFEDKAKQIEILNSQNKKKTLFNKYSLVLQENQSKYNLYPGLDECVNILNESILFLDKVISLYSIETKDLEKQLKDAETTEQIKSIILK